MYRSLYFKIILILVIFIITVMAVVGTILLNSVFHFYTNDFVSQMEQYFDDDVELRISLQNAMKSDNFKKEQKAILEAYIGTLGIDAYRNYYILDLDGNYLEGSSEELGKDLIKTPNLLSAMNKKDGKNQMLGTEYSDYAVYIISNNKECVIYIKDTQEEMRELSWKLFTIILQSLLFGLVIAAILSFFLAKAITSPIQSLTHGAQLIAAGEFTHKIDVHSKDEIGILTDTFNNMKMVLKNTLDEVSGERKKLETIFLYLKDAVIAFYDNGKVMHINKSAVELLAENYNDDLNFNELLSMLNIEYAQTYLSGEITYLSNENKEKSYIMRDIEFNKKALDINFGILKYIENNQTHNGVITVIHDITGRYELDKARREFVADVSHELKTPLTSIKGATETMLKYPDMPIEMRDNFLNMAITESDRMTRIVMDLLTLSKLDKKTQWRIASFNLKNSLSHLCEVMRVEAQKHNHQIILEVAENLPWITADKEKIEQVIINIISNAIKYTPNNGIIQVEAKNIDYNIQINIRDNGIGIPKDDIKRLFERFYRVEKSRTSDTGGTGLGLAIAKEIIISHDGTITIDSEVGIGTEVIITLPIETNLENNS